MAHIIRDDNLTRGRMKRTVLFHTLEEGVVTASTLAKLIGRDVLSVRDCLARMRDAGLLQWTSRDVTPTSDRRFTGHSLTPKGIEAALTVDKTEVLFAVEAEAEGATA